MKTALTDTTIELSVDDFELTKSFYKKLDFKNCLGRAFSKNEWVPSNEIK